MSKGKRSRETAVGVAPLALLILLAGGTGAFAADWPSFRGPNGDGISTETGLLDGWPANGPRIVWRKDLGEGYSGISFVDGRIYTMFGAKGDEYAVCLDAAGGEEVWRTRVGSKWVDTMGNGPRSTPTIDGDTVYVLGSKGNLHALAVADGKPRWSHDLEADFGARLPRWGVSTSPLIEGDLLLLDVGGSGDGSIIAFNKKTGKEVWRSQSDHAGYSTPLAVTIGGIRQVLFFSARNLVSISPADGSLLWRVAWKTSYDVNAAMPVFVAPDRVFISSGYDKGSLMLGVDAADGKISTREIWRNREMKNHFSSSVLHDGRLYGFDDKTLKCIDAGTGELRWRKRGFGHGSLLLADDHLIVLGDHGQLALIEAVDSEYREKGRVQILDSKTWTMPTLAGGRLYLRDERELIALDVTKGADPARNN